MINEAGLISSQDISRDQLFSFFRRLAKPFRRPHVKRPPVGVLAFFEASTRTRVSFEKAGLDLGVQWIHLDSDSLSLKKGETYRDTFKTLTQYQPDFIVVRHSQSGFPFFVHEWMNIPVFNAGDGLRDHPTQGLLDAVVVQSLSQEKLKIGFFGDLVRSRVLRSDLYFLKLLGHQLFGIDDGTDSTQWISRAYDLKLIDRSKMKNLDLVICSRIQTERGSSATQRPLDISDLGAKTWIMHSGPVIAGQDMTLDLFRRLDSKFCPGDISERNLILNQVSSGYMVRRQLLIEMCQMKGLLS